MPKILFSSDAHAHRITLDDPPLHILDIAMLEELRDALAGVTSDRHALIIDASGTKAFSAGASVQDHAPDRVAEMLAHFHACFRTLARLDLTTIALVRGAALGGGCELALACDFVLASDSATFGYPEITLGVFPPVGAWQMARQVLPRRGLELLLGGEAVDAATAASLGMVNAVFAGNGFDAAALAWMERLFGKSASSLRIAKRAWRLAGAREFEERLAETERLYLEELIRTHDASEGLAAFIGKRKPRWENR